MSNMMLPSCKACSAAPYSRLVCNTCWGQTLPVNTTILLLFLTQACQMLTSAHWRHGPCTLLSLITPGVCQTVASFSMGNTQRGNTNVCLLLDRRPRLTRWLQLMGTPMRGWPWTSGCSIMTYPQSQGAPWHTRAWCPMFSSERQLHASSSSSHRKATDRVKVFVTCSAKMLAEV